MNFTKKIDNHGLVLYNKTEVKIMKIETSIYPYNPKLQQLPFLLCGIGGSSYQGHIIREEGYRWHQILACISGRGVLRAEGNETELPEGTFVFLPKDRPHEYLPLTDSWEVDWIAFDGDGCDRALSALDMTDIITARTRDTTSMREIFEKMFISQTTDVLYSGYSCSALVYDYIMGFRRLFNTEADIRKSRDLSRLMPALRFMHDNYSKDIPMPYLASLTGFTHQHLCRVFKSTFNMTPNDYLTNRRLDAAVKLLTETDYSVAEIALKCGFNDAGYFSTVFRRHYGTSPAAYRKNK